MRGKTKKRSNCLKRTRQKNAAGNPAASFFCAGGNDYKATKNQGVIFLGVEGAKPPAGLCPAAAPECKSKCLPTLARFALFPRSARRLTAPPRNAAEKARSEGQRDGPGGSAQKRADERGQRDARAAPRASLAPRAPRARRPQPRPAPAPAGAETLSIFPFFKKGPRRFSGGVN